MKSVVKGVVRGEGERYCNDPGQLLRVQLGLKRLEGLLLETEILPGRGKAFLGGSIAGLRLFQIPILAQLALAVQPFQGASRVDSLSIALIKVFASLSGGHRQAYVEP